MAKKITEKDFERKVKKTLSDIKFEIEKTKKKIFDEVKNTLVIAHRSDNRIDKKSILKFVYKLMKEKKIEDQERIINKIMRKYMSKDSILVLNYPLSKVQLKFLFLKLRNLNKAVESFKKVKKPKTKKN